MKGQIWPAVLSRYVLLFRDSSVGYQSWLMCIMNAAWFTSHKMARDNTCIKFCSFDLHDAIRTWICSTRQISQQSCDFLFSWHLVPVSNEDAILVQHWHPTSSSVLFWLPVVLVSSSCVQLRFFFFSCSLLASNMVFVRCRLLKAKPNKCCSLEILSVLQCQIHI